MEHLAAFARAFRRAASTLGVTLLIVPAAAANAQSRIQGTWFVRYESLVRAMHDPTPRVVRGAARMTLRVRGDSVFGSWEPLVDAGETPPFPSSVRGAIRGDSAEVQIDPPPPENDGFFYELGRDIVQFLKTYVHGMPPMTTHVTVVARGDSLVGTRRSVSADGTKQVPPRLLVATRTPRP